MTNIPALADEPCPVVKLTHAVLIWTHAATGDAAHATLNSVDKGVVKASAESISIAQVHALNAALQGLAVQQAGKSGLSVFPQNLLFSDPHQAVTMWWRPAKAAPQFFDCEELGKIRGVVPMPSLVFLQRGTSLRMCAVQGDTRPDSDTPVFHAPMFNTSASGEVCLGGIGLEPITDFAKIQTNQDAFLRGINTHANGGHRKTHYPHGLYALWRDLIEQQDLDWDDAWLVAMPGGLTLGQWLGGRS